jgi:hypothetical protein
VGFDKMKEYATSPVAILPSGMLQVFAQYARTRRAKSLSSPHNLYEWGSVRHGGSMFPSRFIGTVLGGGCSTGVCFASFMIKG